MAVEKPPDAGHAGIFYFSLFELGFYSVLSISSLLS